MFRTGIDSHSSMLVVKKNYTIAREVERYANITIFTPDYKSLR